MLKDKPLSLPASLSQEISISMTAVSPQLIQSAEWLTVSVISRCLKSFPQWLTWNVHDNSSSFSDNRCPSGHVPAVDAHVVVGVSRSTRYQTHVDSCAARGANTVDGNWMSVLHSTQCDTSSTSRRFCECVTCEKSGLWNYPRQDWTFSDKHIYRCLECALFIRRPGSSAIRHFNR